MKNLYLCALILAVSACNGGGVVAPPVDRALATFPVEASYDKEADEFRVNVNGATAILVHLDDQNALGYDRYAFGGILAMTVKRTPSEGGYAAYGSNLAGAQNWALYGRIEETQLPDAGSAEFSGEYLGVVVPNGSDTATALFTGNATLSADFNAMMISGGITGRENIFANTPNFEDVTLVATSITADGEFSGQTQGGKMMSAMASVVEGEYAGLIAGPNGEEVVGAVSIAHMIGTAQTETGIFITSE